MCIYKIRLNLSQEFLSQFYIKSSAAGQKLLGFPDYIWASTQGPNNYYWHNADIFVNGAFEFPIEYTGGDFSADFGDLSVIDRRRTFRIEMTLPTTKTVEVTRKNGVSTVVHNYLTAEYAIPSLTNTEHAIIFKNNQVFSKIITNYHHCYVKR